MRSFLVVLATMVILATCATAENEAVKNILGTNFGGPHGTNFSDQQFAQAGQTVRFISLRGKERVDGVNITVSSGGMGHTFTFIHGGTGGEEQSLTLGDHEYVNQVVWYTDKHKGHTRVFFLQFSTNTGKSIAVGTRSGTPGSETAPKGYQVGGFVGTDGDEIDSLRVIWTCIYITTGSRCMEP